MMKMEETISEEIKKELIVSPEKVKEIKKEIEIKEQEKLKLKKEKPYIKPIEYWVVKKSSESVDYLFQLPKAMVDFQNSLIKFNKPAIVLMVDGEIEMVFRTQSLAEKYCIKYKISSKRTKIYHCTRMDF